jgi:hypothetical protein
MRRLSDSRCDDREQLQRGLADLDQQIAELREHLHRLRGDLREGDEPNRAGRLCEAHFYRGVLGLLGTSIKRVHGSDLLGP